MSISLAEASKLSTDVLLQGIIETIIKDSPILQELPFIQIVGNSLKYNREKALPTVGWYAPVSGDWTAAEPTFEQVTATLQILGGDADVDNFLKSTRSNIQDLETAVIEQKAKAVQHEFENAFLNGSGASNQPTGLYTILKGTAWVADTAYALEDFVVPTEGLENGFRYEATDIGSSPHKTHATTEPTWPTTEGATVVDNDITWTCRYGNHQGGGVNGATLSFTNLDALIDLVRGGKPDMLLMSKRSRRKLQGLVRASTGALLETRPGMFMEQIQLYNGIPIAVSDWIKDNYTVGAGTTCSAIFAFQMGEGGVCGLSSPEMLQVERLGSLETKDATRTRVKWYVSLALFSTVKAAMLTGVLD